MAKRAECPKCHLALIKQVWQSPYEILCVKCGTYYDPETGEILSCSK